MSSMANAFLKPTVIAATAVGLLYRELVVPRTIWTDAVNAAEFVGAFGDTVTMRVPARRSARTRVLRAGTAITNDVSNEFGVDVKLTTDVYNGAPITDEELTLDIVNFSEQILMPQITAIAEGLEDQAVAEIEGADYEAEMTLNPDWSEFTVNGATDWYRVANRARKLLNNKFVPKANRTLLVGSDVEEEILNSDRFTRNDNIGADAVDALREGTIGRIAGFNVIPSAALEADEAYAYHRTAFVMAARAPRVPQGVAFGTQRSLSEGSQGGTAQVAGIGARWIMDYDYTNTTDRSLVNTWVGTATVKDPVTPSNPASAMALDRAVKIANNS
jgi:hypothetical protein